MSTFLDTDVTFTSLILKPEKSAQNLFPVTTANKTAAAAAKSLQSCLLCATPLTGAHQAPLSMGFSRQEYWSGVPFPSLANKTA